MKKLIFIIIGLLGLEGLYGVQSNMQIIDKKDTKPTRIFIVNYVDSPWIGPIVGSFQKTLDKTHEKISYYQYVWTEKTNNDEFLQEMIDGKPDVVFLPDHLFYARFAKQLSLKTDAHISTYFCSGSRDEILPIRNQSGVFNEYPADKVLDFARKSFKINRLAILGGPLSHGSIEKITGPLIDRDISVDTYIESEWLAYKDRLAEIEKKYDAVWLLLPFGVKDGEYWVDFKKISPLTERLKIPSLGYGGMTSFTRTISVGLVPEKIGQYCASLLYSAVFKKEEPKIEDYVSYDVLIDTEHFLFLGARITDEMTPFLR